MDPLSFRHPSIHIYLLTLDSQLKSFLHIVGSALVYWQTVLSALVMAISDLLEVTSPGLLVSIAVCFPLAIVIYRPYFDSLCHIPGPLICRLSSLWTYYHSYVGDECTLISELHKKYGPVIRIAPNEVCISDGASLAPVYSEKGGFLKAPCYTNFDIEGHQTIFSALDPSHRAVRSKAVLPMFSMSSVRSGNDVVEDCVNRFIVRLKEDVEESKEIKAQTGSGNPINVLNLARSLALDAVCSYLFAVPFGSVEERSSKMSASSFVDALVAVGRFFFLPNWMFLALEMSRTKFYPNREEEESSTKVDQFVRDLVNKSQKEDATYQRRLIEAGISNDEVEIQCKDLIFAGTDSTGMSLSTICWCLARHPDMYVQETILWPNLTDAVQLCQAAKGDCRGRCCRCVLQPSEPEVPRRSNSGRPPHRDAESYTSSSGCSTERFQLYYEQRQTISHPCWYLGGLADIYSSSQPRRLSRSIGFQAREVAQQPDTGDAQRLAPIWIGTTAVYCEESCYAGVIPCSSGDGEGGCS